MSESRPGLAELSESELVALRQDIERRLGDATRRWSADPEEVKKSVARLVLSLVEFVRLLMERQAIRRMDEETLDADEVERVGQALMRLEETVHDIARQFGLQPEDLNLELGPLGRLH